MYFFASFLYQLQVAHHTHLVFDRQMNYGTDCICVVIEIPTMSACRHCADRTKVGNNKKRKTNSLLQQKEKKKETKKTHSVPDSIPLWCHAYDTNHGLGGKRNLFIHTNHTILDMKEPPVRGLHL